MLCPEAHGRTVASELITDRLPEPLEFLVHLPPCYDLGPQRRYPLLVLMHGINSDQTQWERLGASQVADRLIASGELAPFILVLPFDRRWEEPNSSNFGEALVQDLLPHLEDTYRILPGRQSRAVGGLSQGAAWALHLGFEYWQTFSAIGGHSFFVFGNDTARIPRFLDEIPTNQLPRLFLDVGDRDRPELLASARWLVDLLDQRDIPHEVYYNPGYHDEAYWRSHLEQYLRWYAAAW
jgi:enterochelin esterase-like enzyme